MDLVDKIQVQKSLPWACKNFCVHLIGKPYDIGIFCIPNKEQYKFVKMFQDPNFDRMPPVALLLLKILFFALLDLKIVDILAPKCTIHWTRNWCQNVSFINIEAFVEHIDVQKDEWHVQRNP